MAKTKGSNVVEIKAPVGDGLDIPLFLDRRGNKRAQPTTEDMVTAPVLHFDNKPLALAADGMNILETTLGVGTDHESGLRRYLVVSMGTKVAKLLEVATLDSHEIDIRYINDRLATGKSHWYALPINLADRLIAKSVQWEMQGFRYSRALVNEALTNLGRPPLDIPQLEAVVGTVAHERAQRRTVTRAAKGPGVIDSIISILNEGGGTVDEILVELLKRHPERDATMRNTIKTQLNRLPKQGRLEIERIDGKYVAKGVKPSNAPVDPLIQAIADMPKKDFDAGIAALSAGKADLIAKGTLAVANAKGSFLEDSAKQQAREQEMTETPEGRLKAAKVVIQAKRKTEKKVAPKAKTARKSKK